MRSNGVHIADMSKPRPPDHMKPVEIFLSRTPVSFVPNH